MQILKVILSALLSLISVFTTNGFGKYTPHLAVIPDLVRVGAEALRLNVWDDAPDKKEVAAALENTEVPHPFVLAGAERFDLLRLEFASGEAPEYASDLLKYVLANADALLDTQVFPPLAYELDEENSILPISRETMNRIVILGLARQVTGEEKYFTRAWEELENVCNYPDWCTGHFLATAEMALAVSIGYDWLYEDLTGAQRDLLAETTLQYAIRPAISAVNTGKWYTTTKNNWNSICYSGVGIACMTLADRYPAEAAKYLARCFKYMPAAYENFTPDGVYIEGPGYCESGMNAIVYFIATARERFGTDFGMSELPGFRELGMFPVYISGSVGEFNFGDNRNRAFYSPALDWYAANYNEPLLAAHQMSGGVGEYAAGEPVYTESNGDGRENALSALWYDRSFTGDSSQFSSQPKSVYLRSDCGQELVLMRSAYLDKNAFFAGMKAGDNFINHGDLDIGTFVYDALGERWAAELGPGPYDAPGYFFNPPAGGRWRNYCKRAEGQNTLVINPDMTLDDQYALARCVFSDVEIGDDGGACRIDLTDAYRMNGAISAVRSFAFDANTGALTVADEVKCLVKSDIYWFMHTRAAIEISEDGKTAVLTQNGKRITAVLSGDGEFSVRECESLKPNYVYPETHDGVRRLTVALTGVREANISVRLAPEIRIWR
ncbi:MAG: heparinase II/III family protein [Clostridia bacterium]|nr:heparinase II/III family protein [Clostridia bacterium]